MGLYFGNARFLCWMPHSVFFGLPIVSCSIINSLILGCLWPFVFVSNNILTLGIWHSAISHLPGCFAPGPSFIISDSTWCHQMSHLASQFWIFCRLVSGFATDCPCGVCCRGLTTWLLYVGPHFWKSPFKQQLGCRFYTMDCKSSFFTYAIIYVWIHHMLFRLYL